MKKKPDQIKISDSKYIKNIFIQIDLKKNTTLVRSGFSAWENLALIIEGLAVTAEKCIEEGIDKKEVYKAINDYMIKAIPNYKLINKKEAD